MLYVKNKLHKSPFRSGGRVWSLETLPRSLPVHLAQNNTVRDEIAGFYEQTEKGGAKYKARFNRGLDTITT